MTITLHLTSWVVPACVTLILWLAAIAIAVRDLKSAGDYGVPVIGFGAVVGAAVGTLVAWLVWLLV